MYKIYYKFKYYDPFDVIYIMNGVVHFLQIDAIFCIHTFYILELGTKKQNDYCISEFYYRLRPHGCFKEFGIILRLITVWCLVTVWPNKVLPKYERSLQFGECLCNIYF